jgi:lysophospholipase L1-like esterase
MRVLLIGDSLIRGSVGVGFVPLLARQHPEWQLNNAGVNGEPLLSIAQRLRQELASGPAYDAIVIAAGTNDLLLPEFGSRGFWFRQALRHKLRQGHRLLTVPVAFEWQYRAMLRELRSRTKVPVVLLTLACLSEDLGGGLNSQRAIYNDIIRRVASDYQCQVADVAARFDEVLSECPRQDYLAQGFVNTAFADRLQCLLGRADALSRRRGLHLTIDGCHPNSRGAGIFAALVEEQLRLAQALVPAASSQRQTRMA